MNSDPSCLHLPLLHLSFLQSVPAASGDPPSTYLAFGPSTSLLASLPVSFLTHGLLGLLSGSTLIVLVPRLHSSLTPTLVTRGQTLPRISLTVATEPHLSFWGREACYLMRQLCALLEILFRSCCYHCVRICITVSSEHQSWFNLKAIQPAPSESSDS